MAETFGLLVLRKVALSSIAQLLFLSSVLLIFVLELLARWNKGCQVKGLGLGWQARIHLHHAVLILQLSVLLADGLAAQCVRCNALHNLTLAFELRVVKACRIIRNSRNG